jgi:hypothetical protein
MILLPIPSCVAVLSRHSPIIQSHFKTQSESIQSRDGRRKLAKHNNHLLPSRKKSEKSCFNEESAAISLQPKKFAESTQVPLKRATLNTDGRGRVANKGATKRKRHRNINTFDIILTNTREPRVAGTPNATHEGMRPTRECDILRP